MDLMAGDIVVDTWSKAKKLKRKVHRVIESPQRLFTSSIRVIDPWGGQRQFSGYRIRRLEAQEAFAESEIRSAEIAVELAEQKVSRLKKELTELKKELLQVPTYFPRI